MHPRNSHPSLAVAVAVALVAPLSTPVSLLAQQDLKYTTVRSIEFGGFMGTLMSMIPGLNTETRETVWVSGPRMRTDSENGSSFVDWEVGRFANADHESRRYWEIDVDAFGESMQEMAATMDQRMGEVRSEIAAAQEERARTGDGNPEARLDFRVSTERTGRTRGIAGFNASQVLLTIEMNAESLQAARDPNRPDLQQGKMVLFTEMWVTEAPLVAIPEEIDMRGLQQLQGNTQQSMAAFEQIFMNDPDLEIALDRSQAELEDLQGTPVESTQFFVIVPPGIEFDREQVLSLVDQSLSESVDVRGAAAQGAQDAARGALQRGLGGLGGMFGRNRQEEREESEEEAAPSEPTQVIFLRIKNRTEGVERGAVPPGTFDFPPEGYTRMEVPGIGGG
jgi:hypothetical protein